MSSSSAPAAPITYRRSPKRSPGRRRRSVPTRRSSTRPARSAARQAGFAVTIAAVAARTVRQFVRSRQLLITTFVGGATIMVLFRYIFAGAITPGQVAYVDFLVPGMVLTSVLITGTGSATGIADDISQGFAERLRSLPTKRLALIGGRVLAETIVAAIGTDFSAALGFALGFRLHGSATQALAAFGICVVCGFAFAWVFVVLGLAAGNPQAAQGLSMLAYPVIFVSSAYVRVDTLPGWMQPAAEHQPVTAMCDAVRSLALGDPALAGLAHTTGYWVLMSLAWAAGITILFAPLAVLQFHGRRKPGSAMLARRTSHERFGVPSALSSFGEADTRVVDDFLEDLGRAVDSPVVLRTVLDGLAGGDHGRRSAHGGGAGDDRLVTPASVAPERACAAPPFATLRGAEPGEVVAVTEAADPSGDTGRPDPTGATTPTEFVEALRRLKRWTGWGYRRLERQAAAAGHVLPRSTVTAALARDALPREDLVAAFARACGCDDGETARWVTARRGLAAAPGSRPPDGTRPSTPAAPAGEPPDNWPAERHVSGRAAVVSLALAAAIALAMYLISSDSADLAGPPPGGTAPGGSATPPIMHRPTVGTAAPRPTGASATSARPPATTPSGPQPAAAPGTTAAGTRVTTQTSDRPAPTSDPTGPPATSGPAPPAAMRQCTDLTYRHEGTRRVQLPSYDSSVDCVLSYGATGEGVSVLQTALISCNNARYVTLTHVYDQKTAEAVAWIQAASGAEFADGIYRADTRSVLNWVYHDGTAGTCARYDG
ncbi:ABC transporter permease [Actinophytocola sp.]|uniref:ABC transporter permease n=1 Tax=Actinophytocola sp. TaxID=1872138 RepID=UPI0025B92B75|nr:ABC transporter permease [Actinophytocola sp.]